MLAYQFADLFEPITFGPLQSSFTILRSRIGFNVIGEQQAYDFSNSVLFIFRLRENSVHRKM